MMLGDKASGSDAIPLDLHDRGAVLDLPAKRNGHVQHGVSRPLPALRSCVERDIYRLKNSRCVETNCD